MWERYRKKLKIDDVVCLFGKIRYDEFSKRCSVTLEKCCSLNEFRLDSLKDILIEITTDNLNFKLKKLYKIFNEERDDNNKGVTVSLLIKSGSGIGRIRTNFLCFDVESLVQKCKTSFRVDLNY